MGGAKLRIKIAADVRISLTAMFEPLGMAYDLEPGSHMYAEVAAFRNNENELEIIQWPGGISIWAPGAVTTYSADGQKLHDLH
jgi:hypothetical protein